ncbi:hypothetical protein CDCA_CDCA17G4319 [Cyanidium caldarium]|uniref:3-oxo-5-alpha-steroid 4-dehydrogenase C-terminal domain-containing protein n=1 Tax=Cyanidium caldarium TaxID=2771 RepID=A0AAV9J1U9_CYACA|nr:hypothetical protein CDCA_CDCA17G4319 [Cyanidium caldarium]
MSLSVRTRSGRELVRVPLSGPSAVGSVDELRQALYRAHRHLCPQRQRLTIARDASHPVVLEPGHRLDEYGVPSDATADKEYVVCCKDLGPQVSWRTVFVMEYLGPLLVFPLIFLGQLGGGHVAVALHRAHPYQTAALSAWSAHFLKRLLETLFVHRFSNATMPLRNLFKNCCYYWGFAALVAHFVCHPLYTPVASDVQFRVGMALFAVCEVGNGVTHWMLRQLRPAGTRVRRIPHGFLFEWVSCPNYALEIGAWLGFVLATQTLAALLFMLAGAAQMAIWADAKHRKYLRDFAAQYPRCRKRLVPLVW